MATAKNWRKGKPVQQAVKLLRPVQSRPPRIPTMGGLEVPTWECWAKAAIVFAAASLIVVAWCTGVLHSLFRFAPDMRLSNLWLWSVMSYGSIHYAALVWRIVLWLSYRPMAAVPEGELPAVSVVIPVHPVDAYFL